MFLENSEHFNEYKVVKICVMPKTKFFNSEFSYSVCTDLKCVLGYLLVMAVFISFFLSSLPPPCIVPYPFSPPPPSFNFWPHSFQSLVLKFPQAAFSKTAQFVGVIGLLSTHRTHYSLFILSSSINTFAALRPAPFCMPVISVWWVPSCFCKCKGVARIHFGDFSNPVCLSLLLLSSIRR